MGRHREFDSDQALDAALTVFWQKGYEGTSFEDLTAATGVARPGLYAAFGNKEALFHKVVDRYEATYMGFMRGALEAPTSYAVVKEILTGSVAVQTLYASHRGCLGLNGALACSSDGDGVRRDLVRRRNASEAALRQRLERAQAEGDLPPSADSAVLAGLVMTLSQGLAVQAKAGAPKPKLMAMAEQFLSTWPARPKR